MADPLNRLTLQAGALIVAAAIFVAGCSPSHEEEELAPFMGELQRHSHKLGLSIRAENQPLAEFYLHEVEEVLEELAEEIPEHDGFPLADLIATIMDPLQPPLSEHLKARDWPAARGAYEALIEGCNRCHSSTEHEFLVMLPGGDPRAFNQDFSPRQPALVGEDADSEQEP